MPDDLEAIVPLPEGFVLPDGGGLRYDEGKERVDLLPGDSMLELGKVYGVGARKYAMRNWERGMPWSKVLGPLLRHLFKWMMGEERDPEDNQRHIAKVAWNAIALLTYELRGIGVDDRGITPARGGRIERAVMPDLGETRTAPKTA